MTTSYLVSGTANNALLLRIAESVGFQDVINMRRENTDNRHVDMEPFNGDYTSLFDAFHGVYPLSKLLADGEMVILPNPRKP